ncbi:MAG: NYN domain-containing protein [Candidatus Promineifilaceae bacterium]
MRYLIDGHNLIAEMATITLGDPNVEAELVLLLRRWTAGSRKRKVTIVFDGGLPGGENRLLSTSNVKVVFASANRTADDLLISRIRRLDNPSEYTVVTDDRAVIAEVQKRKAIWLSSEVFAQSMDKIESQDDASEPATNPVLSDAEIVEWLEIFKGDQPG